YDIRRIVGKYFGNATGILDCPARKIKVNWMSIDMGKRSANMYGSYMYFPGRKIWPHFGDPKREVPIRFSDGSSYDVLMQDECRIRPVNDRNIPKYISNHGVGSSSDMWGAPLPESRDQMVGAVLGFYDGRAHHKTNRCWCRFQQCLWRGSPVCSAKELTVECNNLLTNETPPNHNNRSRSVGGVSVG
ncbi:MAG: hypothetical protein QGI90_11290, partial [Nitrospinaceae bacterium]|nr:hypothetical protein [Nitrospinaceae bacterium]